MTPTVWPPSATHPILVAVELDGSSEAAIGVGRDLAERYGAGVVLAHVFTAPAYPHLVTHREVIPGEAAAFEAKARAGLTALAGSVPDARTVLREGFPEEVLPQIIEELRPALVIVGFHGRKGVARAILGSVAEKVIRASIAPVLVARSAGTTA